MLRTESISNKREGLPINLSYFGIIILGFLISRVNILNNLTPFGIAFLGSYLMLKKANRWLLFSVILGIFTVHGFGGGYYYIVALLIYTFFDVINTGKNYTLIRASLYAGLIFLGVRSLFLIILRRFIIYDIFTLGFESVLIFTMTYVFSFSLPIDKIKKRKFSNEQLICSFITIALALSGFNNINLYGVSLKNIISIVLVIHLSHNYGILAGVGGSIVVGMVSYISHTEMPFIIAIFAVGGLLAGLFRELGKAGSILGFLLGNGIVSFYINNFGTSFLDYRELLISSISFLIVSRYIKDNVEGFLSEGLEIKKDYNSKKDKITINKLNNTSQLLNSISNILNKSVKNQKEYSPSRIYDLIDEISSKTCKSCFKRNQCWGADYHNTYQNFFNLMGNVETKSNRVGLSIEEFRDFCVNYKILYDNTVEVYEIFKENESWNSKLIEQKKLLAEQVKYLGKMVRDVAKDIDINPIFNEELVELLTKELKNRRIDVAEVTAIELEKNELEILVELNSPVNSKFRMDKIREIISKALGFPMSYDFSFGNLKEDGKNFKLVKTSRYSSMTRISRAPNSENLVSGDSYTFGETNNISFLAISDGMGIGKKANEESGIAIELLEKLMEANMDKNMIIKTINSILRTRTDEEIFTTLDLAFIDLYTGRLQILKNGSPATFIKKKDRVEMVNTRSLPIGILEDVDFDIYEKKLEDGDILIMMSDGVLESNREVDDLESWMKGVIENIDSHNPQAIADEILNTAKLVSKNKPKDDMTILATKIWHSI